MARLGERWWARPQIWIEVFAILNVGFLTFDIYLAHSVNQFHNQAEYIPLFFSATAPLVLIFALAVRYRWPAVWKDLGYLVGWSAVLVGLIDTIGRAFLPDILRLVLSSRGASTVAPALSSMLIYLLMAIVLVLRPEGLFPANRR